MNANVERQIAEMKKQTIGIEVEMNNISRDKAARIASELFGTHRYSNTAAQVMESGKYRQSGAKKVLFAVCDALTVLHRQGIIHRDVKPENVMIEKSGRVVLIDLNASRVESRANKDTVIMGTVGYASPEQLGLSQTDARTDIYAAGVLYNVLLTGQHPSITIASEKAGRIVRKCTAVNPNERYQTAAELWSAL